MTLFFLGFLVIVSIGVWMLTLDPSEFKPRLGLDQHWTALVLPWVPILFFGTFAVLAVRRAVDRRPQIVLTPGGFYCRKWSQVEIPWSEIVEVAIMPQFSIKFITIILWDRARYIQDDRDLAIPTLGLDRSAEEILEAIERFWEPATRP